MCFYYISIDVERTFMAYKTILSKNRRAFLFENLRKYLTIQQNNEDKILICIES